MRLLTVLAATALLGSAFLASRHYARREESVPIDRFITKDPAARVREGEAAKELGVAMAGYEELLKNHPEDADALRGRIRTAYRLGAVGLGQPRLPEFVYSLAQDYLANRQRIDPDGKFLQEMVRQWVEGRLQLDWKKQVGFYARASAAIFTAARGDPRGLDAVLEFTRQGAFYLEFFPFARRYHPAWPVVEPLVTLYLQQDDLGGRVEAGVTLLDYADLFGVGGDLVERFLPVIRDSVREMRERVRVFSDDGASDSGRMAIVGMAFLANRGDEEEMRLLNESRNERELARYAPHADAVRIARLWVGLDPFSTMGPLTVRFKDLDPMDQEIYYLAVAHRAAHLLRHGGPSAEVTDLLDLLESAYDGLFMPPRVFAMQALLHLAPERGAALVARGLDARGNVAVYAGALADRLDDPVALFLPYIASPTWEVGALSAASLLDLPFPRALQR